MKKDNAGKKSKIALRRQALLFACESPIVLETHGGEGVLYEELYQHLPPGVVLEKDECKANYLAEQRPEWRVYEADSPSALAAGITDDMNFDFVDVDPYGEPWTTITAFLSRKNKAPSLVIAVNDGLRRNIKMNTAWKAHCLAGAVEQFGNDLHDRYLSVCRWMMEKEAVQAGYYLDRFEGFYAGYAKQMTHYYAVLKKDTTGTA